MHSSSNKSQMGYCGIAQLAEGVYQRLQPLLLLPFSKHNAPSILDVYSIVHHCKAPFCLFVFFNCCKTTGRTKIKLGTIDHLAGISVMGGWQRNDDIIIKRN